MITKWIVPQTGALLRVLLLLNGTIKAPDGLAFYNDLYVHVIYNHQIHTLVVATSHVVMSPGVVI